MSKNHTYIHSTLDNAHMSAQKTGGVPIAHSMKIAIQIMACGYRWHCWQHIS
jgi:hypothetical protein